MKKVYFNLLICFSFIFLANQAIGARVSNLGGVKTPVIKPVIEIDLASPVLTDTYSVSNGEPFDITIINFLPSAHYNITKSMADVSPGLSPVPAAVAAPARAVMPTCASLIAALDGAGTEVKFALAMAEAKVDQATCTAYANYYKFSTKTYTDVKLTNQILTITITNKDSNVAWTFKFVPRQRGRFLTTYGFTFIPLGFSKPETYYAQPQTSTTGTTTTTNYLISKGSSESKLDFAPTVLFHYAPYSSRPLSVSYTGGLGINFSSSINSGISPTVLAGISLLYYQNVGLSFGLAGHTLNRLKGKYAPGQVIATNLESTDLNEKVIRVNPFISVTFRFSSNPFGTGGGSSSLNTNGN